MAIPFTEMPPWVEKTRAAVTMTPQWVSFTEAVNSEIDKALAKEQLSSFADLPEQVKLFFIDKAEKELQDTDVYAGFLEALGTSMDTHVARAVRSQMAVDVQDTHSAAHTKTALTLEAVAETAAALLHDSRDRAEMVRVLLGQELPRSLRPEVWQVFLRDPPGRREYEEQFARDRKATVSRNYADITRRCQDTLDKSYPEVRGRPTLVTLMRTALSYIETRSGVDDPLMYQHMVPLVHVLGESSFDSGGIAGGVAGSKIVEAALALRSMPKLLMPPKPGSRVDESSDQGRAAVKVREATGSALMVALEKGDKELALRLWKTVGGEIVERPEPAAVAAREALEKEHAARVAAAKAEAARIRDDKAKAREKAKAEEAAAMALGAGGGADSVSGSSKGSARGDTTSATENEGKTTSATDAQGTTTEGTTTEGTTTEDTTTEGDTTTAGETTAGETTDDGAKAPASARSSQSGKHKATGGGKDAGGDDDAKDDREDAAGGELSGTAGGAAAGAGAGSAPGTARTSTTVDTTRTAVVEPLPPPHFPILRELVPGPEAAAKLAGLFPDAFNRLMVGTLSLPSLLYVWDQAVVAGFDKVMPQALACVLHCLRDDLLRVDNVDAVKRIFRERSAHVSVGEFQTELEKAFLPHVRKDMGIDVAGFHADVSPPYPKPLSQFLADPPPEAVTQETQTTGLKYEAPPEDEVVDGAHATGTGVADGGPGPRPGGGLGGLLAHAHGLRVDVPSAAAAASSGWLSGMVDSEPSSAETDPLLSPTPRRRKPKTPKTPVVKSPLVKPEEPKSPAAPRSPTPTAAKSPASGAGGRSPSPNRRRRGSRVGRAPEKPKTPVVRSARRASMFAAAVSAKEKGDDEGGADESKGTEEPKPAPAPPPEPEPVKPDTPSTARTEDVGRRRLQMQTKRAIKAEDGAMLPPTARVGGRRRPPDPDADEGDEDAVFAASMPTRALHPLVPGPLIMPVPTAAGGVVTLERPMVYPKYDRLSDTADRIFVANRSAVVTVPPTERQQFRRDLTEALRVAHPWMPGDPTDETFKQTVELPNGREYMMILPLLREGDDARALVEHNLRRLDVAHDNNDLDELVLLLSAYTRETTGFEYDVDKSAAAAPPPGIDPMVVVTARIMDAFRAMVVGNSHEVARRKEMIEEDRIAHKVILSAAQRAVFKKTYTDDEVKALKGKELKRYIKAQKKLTKAVTQIKKEQGR